jgi:uncharacterized protein (DUF305 family)
MFRQHRRRSAHALAATAAGAVLAACGGMGDHDMDSMAEQPLSTQPAAQAQAGPSPSASADFNEADVTFAQSMIPHHEQAVEMAKLAEENGSSPAVRKLAAEIEAAQSPEIKKMRAWLATWGRPEAKGMAGMDHGGGDMPGMMSSKEMAALKATTGRKFDDEFLKMMAEHHRGAIAMAKTEQKEGQNPEAQALAADVISAQTAEIARIEKLLGADSTPSAPR